MSLTGRWQKVAQFVGVLLLTLTTPMQVLAQSTDVTIGVGDTSIHVTGTTSPNALVTIMDNGAVIGSATANSSGAFLQHLTDQAPGIRSLEFFAQDAAGHFTDTISITLNVVEHAQTNLEVFLPPVVRLAQTEVVAGENVTVLGSTAPGATLVVAVDDIYATATADSAGNWTYTFTTTGFAPGQHSVSAVAATSGGSQSYPSQRRSFVVQAAPVTAPPATPTPTPAPGPIVPLPQSPRIISPTPGQIIVGDSVEVVGTAEPGSQVEVWNRNAAAGSVFADKDGNWRLRISLDEAANSLKARACRNGVCSEFSASTQFFRERAMGGGPMVWLESYRLRTVAGDTMPLKATIRGGEHPYKVVVTWGDGTQDHIETANLELQPSHAYQKAGNYSGKITVTDAQERSAVAYFSVEVLPRADASWGAPQIIIGGSLLLIAFFCGQWAQKYWRKHPRHRGVKGKH